MIMLFQIIAQIHLLIAKIISICYELYFHDYFGQLPIRLRRILANYPEDKDQMNLDFGGVFVAPLLLMLIIFLICVAL